MIEKINQYLIDKEYRIIIKENQVNIINYDEIVDFTSEKISLKYKNKNIIIEGRNLFISKMVEDEALIEGDIFIVRIN